MTSVTSVMAAMSLPVLFLWEGVLVAYDPSVTFFLPVMIRCFGLTYQMED